MQKPDAYELISAYLDGELSAAELEVVERLLATSEEHQALFQDLKQIREGLKKLPKYELSADFSQRILRQIAGHPSGGSSNEQPASLPGHDRMVAGNRSGTDSGSNRSPRKKSRRFVHPFGALLALATAAAAIMVWISVQRSDRLQVSRPPDKGNSLISQVPNSPDSSGESAVEGGIELVRRSPKWSIIFDITVTPRGQKNRVFENLLGKYGIRVDNVVKVDSKLEEKIIASHFLENAKIGTNAAPKVDDETVDVVHLIYVEATSMQIDALVMDCQDKIAAGEVAKLPWYHLVFELDKQDVLQQIQHEINMFARQRGSAVENIGFRLEFRSALGSLPGALATITAPLVPNIVPQPNDSALADPTKGAVEKLANSNLEPALPPMPRPDRPQVADTAKPMNPGQLLFIVRNLK